MKETEIQQRVLQNGKPLDLDKFEWDEKTKTFSTGEDWLIIDFSDIHSTTIDAGSESMIDAGDNSMIKAGEGSTIDAGDNSMIDAGEGSTINAGDNSMINAGDNSTIDAGEGSTIDAGSESTIKAGDNSTIDAGEGSTIDAGDNSTIDAGEGSTIDAGDNSMIKAGYSSTITANGDQIVIVNRGVFEVIQPEKGQVIQICPYAIKGHLVDGMYNGEPHIIADGILSKVISKKKNIYKLINHGKKTESFLIEIEKDGKKVYSHGKTLKEARESLVYKLADRDTSKYKDLIKESILTKEDAIQCYMAITGACGAGTKYFVDSVENPKDKYSVNEIIKLTKSKYGNEQFKSFFNK